MKVARFVMAVVGGYLLSSVCPVSAQSANVTKEIVEINKRTARYFIERKTDSLTAMYADGFWFIPEYKPAINQIDVLKEFYSQWLAGVTYTAWEKKIYKVEVLSQYVLEIGYFTTTYRNAAGDAKTYKGKYMVMWQRARSTGKLKIVSEAFGADSYVDAGGVPYAAVVVADAFVLNKNRLSTKLLSEMEEIDKELLRTIAEGDGKGRASGFIDDGIYMPHFEPMLEGMSVLLRYLIKTYKPGAGIYASNSYCEVFDLGEYVFLNGHFKGGWGDKTNGGTFEGNMSNLMKREKDGKLKMYRQLVNNDR